MIKVPFYTSTNYKNIITKSYEKNDKSNRVELSDFFSIMDIDYLNKYGSIDAREISNYFVNKSLNQTIQFAGGNKKLQEVITASKLLMPTLRACDYFLWNSKSGTHSGIDIILPQGTPILSFTSGTVTRIKKRDGIKKDEGNCVVINTNNQRYSYKHLDSINVKHGDIVNVGDQIGLCGSTGQSTQFHLHFQIDAAISPFNPYRSNQLPNVLKNTIDPIPALRDIMLYSKIFVDMPVEQVYKVAIEKLFLENIVKGHKNKVYPNNTLSRLEAALLFHRIASKYNIYSQIAISNPMFVSYDDFAYQGEELEAIKQLQKYDIMRGHENKFWPEKDISGEEVIAIMGRMLFGIKNMNSGIWYKPYLNYFEEHNLIKYNRQYLGKSILRKDMFVLIYDTLKYKGVIK